MSSKVPLQNLVAAVIIFALLVGVYIFYTLMESDQNHNDTPTSVTEVNKNTLGYIYFTATPKDFVTQNEAEHTSLFAFDVDTKSTIPVIGNGVVQSFAPVPPNRGALVYYDQSASGAENIRVGGVDFQNDRMDHVDTPSGWYESDLNVSPDSSTLLFSQMKMQDDDSVDELDIHNWEVVIYSTSSGPIVLDQAIHPQWVHNGADIFFMKQGGIYKYNIATKDTVLIYNVFIDLNTINDFVMSADDSTLVITIPGLNLIQVLKLSAGIPQELNETIQITTPEVGFFYPVFSPDSESFAVRTVPMGDEGVSPLVQIFNANTTELITSIELDKYKAMGFQLQAWDEVLVNRNFYDQ